MEQLELIKFLMECKRTGLEYRNRFRAQWDDCESQIRCVLPESYKNKEDWQTKIFIPLQAKMSEVVQSYINKMIFSKTSNFEILGLSDEKKDDDVLLTDLISSMMNNGGFQFENKFVVNEAVDIGTGFIKLTLSSAGNLLLRWRTSYNVLLDPACGQDFDNSRFFVDQFTKDIAYIIEEAKKDKSLYDKEVIAKFLEDAIEEGKKLEGKPNPEYSQTAGTGIQDTQNLVTNTENQDVKQALMVVKGIDGTNYITMPSKYRTVGLDEYWVKVPNTKGTYDMKVVTVLNDRYVLREDDNPFGFIPAQWCRLKVRKYDCYGRGYIDNTRGLQELSNSIVNLGFDSLKINSMDIIILDETKVRDPNSIKYKPLAVWKMKDVNGARLQRNPLSAISDVLKGLTTVDMIHQDASGATRQAQGAPNLSGAGTQSETLGEYQLKLQAIDQRFLDQARFIEQDYMLPLVKKVYRILRNPKLFSQDKVDAILGTKIIETADIQVDPMGNPAVVKNQKRVPVLDLKKIQSSREDELDFQAIGVTQFTDKLEMIAKYKEVLSGVLQSDVLGMLTKIPVLWKKVLQAAEIPDYQEIIKTEDEIKSQLQGMAPPPGAGGPMPNMPQSGGGMPPAAPPGMIPPGANGMPMGVKNMTGQPMGVM